MALENQKSVAMKVVDKIEKQAAIRKVISKKLNKTPHFFDDGGGMSAYYKCAGRLVWAVVGVTLIIPLAIVGGMLGGVSRGAASGIAMVAHVNRAYLK